jgi:hypothetical protein
MTRTTLLLAGVLLLAGAAQASAQSDVVPREFVNVLLLSGSEGPDEMLRVGVLSDMFHGLTPARGERVIGTLQRRTTATAALAVPGDAADVHAAWERRLETAGWRPREGRPVEQQRGFVTAQEPTRAQAWCWPVDESSIHLRTIDAPGDETYVVFSLTPGPRGICGPSSGPSERRSPYLDMLPALPAPPGARVFGTGGGGGSDRVNQTAQIYTELTTAALFEHYGRLMREQGWEPADDAVGETSGVTVWRRSGDAGVRTAWLSGVRVPDGTVIMEVTVLLIGGA